MGAFVGVQSCFNKPLIDIAISLGYDEDNILILEGNERGLRTQHLQTYQNLLSCSHHADRRTPIEYGQDLVASWIFEDTFLMALKRSSKFIIDLDGADRNRKILSNVQTSSSSDYLIRSQGGIPRKLELMSDYTGYWARTGKLHLRDAKYQGLQNSQSLFIAVSTVTKDFALYDFGEMISAKYIPSHRPYGYKPAYELAISHDMMIPYTSNNLVQRIEAVF